MLNHYRAALAFRRAHPALVNGSLEDLSVRGDVLSFIRRGDGEEVFCAFNLSAEGAAVTAPEGDWMPVGESLGSAAIENGTEIPLGAWQCCLARRAR